MSALELFRAPLFHTRADPSLDERAFVCPRRRRRCSSGTGASWRAATSTRSVAPLPMRPSSIGAAGCCLPGFVDAHVHFPQLRVIGCLGLVAPRLARARRVARRGADGRRGVRRPIPPDDSSARSRPRHNDCAGVRVALCRRHRGPLRGGRSRSGLRVICGLVSRIAPFARSCTGRWKRPIAKAPD